MSVQAIAGVSASTEAPIMTVTPSVSRNFVGQLIGSIMDLIPIRVLGLTISRVLFGLPLAPLGAVAFLVNKGFGPRYVLTNRSVQVWNSSKTMRKAGVDLNEIAKVELVQQGGQAYFRAADVRLVSASGATLLWLRGVAEAQTFASAIRRATDARRLVQSSLSAIQARGDG